MGQKSSISWQHVWHFCLIYDENNYSTESNSRLALKHLLIVTLQEDSIKGNLWHVVTFFKDQGRKTSSEWQHQNANLISSSLTGLLQGHLSSSLSLLPSFMPPCVSLASSDTFWLLSLVRLSYHPLALSSPPALSTSAPPSPSFSHSDTLFSIFPVTSWELTWSQRQTKGQEQWPGMNRPQQKCTAETGKHRLRTDCVW